MFSFTKGRSDERTRYRTRLEFRRKMHPASGCVFSLVILASLIVFGPAAVVGALFAALGILAAWLVTRRTGAKVTTPPRSGRTRQIDYAEYADTRYDRRSEP